MTGRSVLMAMLACATLFIERISMDEVTSYELRGQICTHNAEPHFHLETRTWERTLGAAGYRFRRVGGEAEEADSPQESWWAPLKDIRLYVVTDPK